MPITVKYLDNGLGILLLGKGVVTGEEWIQCNKEIFSSGEKIINCKYGLIDYSNAEDLIATNEDVETIARQDKEASRFLPEGVVAVVASKDIEFGLSRMWEIVVESEGIPWKTMVFREKEAAKDWIKQIIKERHDLDLTFE